MDKQKRVEDLIKNSDGLSIQDLSNKLNISRITITKILARLEGEKKVKIRNIGPSKIYLWIK